MDKILELILLWYKFYTRYVNRNFNTEINNCLLEDIVENCQGGENQVKIKNSHIIINYQAEINNLKLNNFDWLGVLKNEPLRKKAFLNHQ